MSVIVEVAIFPTDKDESVSSYVARAIKIIRNSGVSWELNAMGTCIEGEWKEVMEVVEQCFEDLKKDSNRIYLTLKVDYRKGVSNRLKSKVATVKSKL